MFYIEMIDKEYMSPHLEHQDGFIEVDDDIKNFSLYYFDKENNHIIKRQKLETMVTEIDGNVVMDIECPDNILVRLFYSNNIEDKRITDDFIHYVEAKDGIARLTMQVELDGMLEITCPDSRYTFDPIIIETENRIDNELEPVIQFKQNTIIIGCSLNYKRFRTLQKELESIKKILADSGLVDTNE